MTLLPIILPDGFIPKVSVNDKIAEGDALAGKEGSLSEQSINISSKLNIPPSKISKFLIKNLGDKVEEGDAVAVKKGALGMGSKKVLSQFSGTVVKIDEEKGDLLIKSSLAVKKDEIISPVEGTVDFCNNEKIVIKTDKNVLVADDSLGGENTGELLPVESLDLNEEIENKVIILKSIDKISLFKAIGLGALGIITNKIEGMDFVDLQERPIEVSLAIVSGENFEKLIKNKGKKVYLNGKNKNIVIL